MKMDVYKLAFFLCSALLVLGAYVGGQHLGLSATWRLFILLSVCVWILQGLFPRPWMQPGSLAMFAVAFSGVVTLVYVPVGQAFGASLACLTLFGVACLWRVVDDRAFGYWVLMPVGAASVLAIPYPHVAQWLIRLSPFGIALDFPTFEFAPWSLVLPGVFMLGALILKARRLASP